MSLEAIVYSRGSLKILDQLLLPHRCVYINIENTADAWSAIKKMQVRGAPAIAVVGLLSFAVELVETDFESSSHLCAYSIERLNYLVTARPTAVNMNDCKNKFVEFISNLCQSEADVSKVVDLILIEIENFKKMDLDVNKRIGKFGAEHLIKDGCKTLKILTHCNTGSLATSGYGTALGVVRSLHNMNVLEHVYCTETRPYNQGSRLTAYELVQEKIPSTLICDSMVTILMKERNIDAVIVGADRIVSNGDTANKIGTHQIAVVAKHFGVPFYVAAPTTTLDLSLASGNDINIEERPADEMVMFNNMRTAPPEIGVWNPAFDVTPADLITGGIITEFGVFKSHNIQTIQQFYS